jgi:hypothetical protein
MYTLHLQNFQSIVDQEFKFKGFVAITGPSNLGKSAVRRALGSVLYNDWQPNFQRNFGKKKIGDTTLTFAKEGEYTITQSKPTNSFKIEITGKPVLEFGKVGRTVPDEVRNLGYKTLDVNDSFLNLNVTKQTDQLFMVSYQASTNTGILNELFNLTQLEKASVLASKDQRTETINMNRADKDYQAEEVEVKNTTAKLEELVIQRDSLRKILGSITVLDEFSTNKGSLSTSNQTLDNLTEECIRHSRVLTGLQSLGKITEYKEALEGTTTTDKRLLQVSEDLGAYETSVVLLGKVQKLDSFIDASQNQATSETLYSKASTNIGIYQSGLDLLAKATKLDLYCAEKETQLFTTTRLTSVTDKLVELQSVDRIRPMLNYAMSVAKSAKATSLLADMSLDKERLEALLPVFTNVSLLSNYFELELSRQHADDDLADVENRLQGAKEEFNSLPRCGECKQVLLEDHNHA